MAVNLGASVVEVKNANTDQWVAIPPSLIRYETYKITPDQVVDLDSFRNSVGQLQRNVLPHTSTKIEFTTPYINDAQWKTIWTIISNGFRSPGGSRVTGAVENARSCRIRYWNPLTDVRKTAWVYVPDVDLTIRNVDFDTKEVNFDETRIAFIEY